MISAGIDPGQTGAMVHLHDDGGVNVFRVPLMVLKGKKVIAEAQWASEWNTVDAADLYVIERVGSMPGQGVSSTFKFGDRYGFVKALAYAQRSPVHFVTPASWKAKMGLRNSDKDASREMARRLIPALAPFLTRKMDDGVAEAGLLALYGRRYLAM